MNGPASFISPCNADPSTVFLVVSHDIFARLVSLFKEA